MVNSVIEKINITVSTIEDGFEIDIDSSGNVGVILHISKESAKELTEKLIKSSTHIMAYKKE